MHARSVVVDGEFETYVPAGQVCHDEQDVWFEELVNVPAVHAVHTRSFVLVPAVDTYVPATQFVIAVHDDAPAAEKVFAPQDVQLPAFVPPEYVPAEHVVHTRSFVVVPAVDTYVPAAHVWKLVHEPASVVVENVPAPHVVHARSTEAVGVVDTYVPAAHVDQAEQELAFVVLE